MALATMPAATGLRSRQATFSHRTCSVSAPLVTRRVNPRLAAQVALAGVFCAAQDGHHLLISASGEAVRFSLSPDAQVLAFCAHSPAHLFAFSALPFPNIRLSSA